MDSPVLDSNKLCENELTRFSRHIALPEIGISGQKKLKSASVLCIGVGGLGSPLLLYLAAAGIGRIGIVDFDIVECSNLQRQIIHGTHSIGELKTNSAKERILDINPNCTVELFNTKLSSKNALKIIENFEIICDCTDNFPSRYLINDACVILKKPNIYGSIQGFEGQVSVFNLNEQSPNYRDLVPTPPPLGLTPSCSEGGVLGVLPGIIGIIQATEVIKIITKAGSPLDGQVLVFNALSMNFKHLNLQKSNDDQIINKLIDYEDFCGIKTKSENKSENFNVIEISVTELQDLLKSGRVDVQIIDVRTPNEARINKIPGSELIPLSTIDNGSAINRIRELITNKKLYIYCQTGLRSMQAIAKLQEYGIQAINITGGSQAWENQFDN